MTGTDAAQLTCTPITLPLLPVWDVRGLGSGDQEGCQETHGRGCPLGKHQQPPLDAMTLIHSAPSPTQNINPWPGDDDPTATPTIPASWATACGVEHEWNDNDTPAQLQEWQGMPEPAATTTDDAPPTPSLMSSCSWGGSWLGWQWHQLPGWWGTPEPPTTVTDNTPSNNSNLQCTTCLQPHKQLLMGRITGGTVTMMPNKVWGRMEMAPAPVPHCCKHLLAGWTGC